MHVESRRQLVGGGPFLPLCEFQGWKAGPQMRWQAPLHTHSLDLIVVVVVFKFEHSV